METNSFVMELLTRRAEFACLDASRPFSKSSFAIIVTLTPEEAEAFRKVKFDIETARLAKLRCKSCEIGKIYCHKLKGHLQYNCACRDSIAPDLSGYEPLDEQS